MHFRQILVVILIIGSVPDVAAAQSWLCTGDQSVGFAKKGDAWQVAPFKPSAKYVVRPLPKEYHQYLSGPLLELKYGAFEFGKAGPAYCRHDFLYKDTWVCGEGFYFNRTTLRFLHFFAGGYVHGLNNSDTPSIEIGTCTVLE